MANEELEDHANQSRSDVHGGHGGHGDDGGDHDDDGGGPTNEFHHHLCPNSMKGVV